MSQGTGGVNKQATTTPFESALYSKTTEQVPLPVSVLVLGWSTLGNSYNKSTWYCVKCWGQETSTYRSSDCSFVCVSSGWADDFRLLLPCSCRIWLSSPDTPCPLCHSLCISHLSAFFPVSSISLRYKHIFFYPGILFTWTGFSLYAKGPMDFNPQGTLRVLTDSTVTPICNWACWARQPTLG